MKVRPSSATLTLVIWAPPVPVNIAPATMAGSCRLSLSRNPLVIEADPTHTSSFSKKWMASTPMLSSPGGVHSCQLAPPSRVIHTRP